MVQKTILLTWTLSFFSVLLLSQVTFKQENQLVRTDSFKSTLSIGIADINGDHWDDIIRLRDGVELEVNLGASNVNKTFKVSFGNVMNAQCWTLTVADLDNNGINEIIAAGAYTGAHVIQFSNDKLVKRQIAEGEFYSQASNAVDINGDGWVDWFVCDDEGLSDIYINNQYGDLTRDETVIDLRTQPVSDNSGNYGSEWADLDNDGDLELYISKCKASVTDPTDPRRVNMLFENVGNQQYREVAQEWGMDIGDQSWVTAFGDLDNDGDLDAIVLNHGTPHSLMENLGNRSFQNRSEQIDLLKGDEVHAIMRDFDNNGFLDILLSGSNHSIIYNDGDFNFRTITNPLPYYNPTSFAIGDLNRDGFLDIYAGYASGFTKPGFVDDILWLNQGNQNHYIAFSLRGTSSNANGIGARLTIFTPAGLQIREVRSGESYGIMNSLNVHFGLGVHDKVDSLIVRWPSGASDVYYNLNSGSYYHLTESVCLREYKKLWYPTDRFCEGYGVVVGTQDKFAQYRWSHGQQAPEITVSASNLIGLVSMDDYGCEIMFDPVFFEKSPSESFFIHSDGGNVACAGDTLVLNTGFQNTIWDDGSVGEQWKVTRSGVFTALGEGTCQIFNDTTELTFLEMGSATIRNDTVGIGETAVLEAQEELINWFYTLDDDLPFHTGRDLIWPNVMESVEFYVEPYRIHRYDPFYFGMEEPQGTSLYSSNFLSGTMFFNAEEDYILESVVVHTDTPGIRKIQLKNNQGQILQENSVFINEGTDTLQLNFYIPAGQLYTLGTSSQTNLIELGHSSPRLVRSNLGADYPYESQGLTMVNSSFGPQYYLYFFNWRVRKSDLQCAGSREPVQIILDHTTAINGAEGKEVLVFPNPADHVLYIQSADMVINFAVIYNIFGAKVRRIELNSSETIHQLDLSLLESGCYFIHLENSSGNTEFITTFIRLP